jgi:hypothetical protein
MRIRNAFGVEFHGALGTSMIAETWNGINYVKSYAVPRNPRTPRQQRGRVRFADAVAAWQALPEAEKEAYKGSAVGMSGYNAFLSRFMMDRVGRPPSTPSSLDRRTDGGNPPPGSDRSQEAQEPRVDP